MFLPIGDQPNPRGTPFINYSLIALNVVVFVIVSLPLMSQPADPADPMFQEYLNVVRDSLPPGVTLDQVTRQMSAYDLFVFDYGYRPAEPSIVTLFSSMFLHGSLMHLLGNMLFLWIYGDNVEHRLGATAYLVWYLVTGAAATLFHAAFASDSPIPLVGASGAISGVLGFYFIWFPHNQVRVLMFLFFIIRVFMLPARWVLGFYILLQNIVPFFLSQGQGGVAHGAHIGGFIAGVAVAFVMNRREVVARPTEYRTGYRREEPQSVGEAIASAIEKGRFEKASELYFDIPSIQTRRLLEPDASIALGNWLVKKGHSRAALTVYQRHLRDYPNGPGAAEAHAYAGLVQLHAFGEATAAYQHLMEALDFDPPPELEVTIRKSIDEIASLQKFPVRERFH